MKNCYSKLLKHMQKQGSAYNPPSISTGIVISEDPLTISIGDLPIDTKNLLVSDFLVKNYKRKIKIPSTPATSNGNISSIEFDAELSFTSGLKKDDIVACLATQDRQTYIVLAKVIRP